jgi:hypothetical protein
MLVLNIFFVFILDIIFFQIFNGWLVSFLPLYFLFINCLINKKYFFYLNYIFIFFLLIQDYLFLERVGISLFYIIPTIFFSSKLRRNFNFGIFSLSFVFITFLLSFNTFLVKNVLFNQDLAYYSTIKFIFINILIGNLIFLGMPGNRPNLFGLGRKVRTPNKMNAL